MVEKNSTISKYAVEPIPLHRNHISRSPRHIHPPSSPNPYTPRSHPNSRERIQECTRDRRGGVYRLPLICIPSPTRLSTAHINPPPHSSHNHRSEISMPIVRLRRAPLLFVDDVEHPITYVGPTTPRQGDFLGRETTSLTFQNQSYTNPTHKIIYFSL